MYQRAQACQEETVRNLKTTVRDFYFLTHPNVQIDAGVPVPQWGLSEKGRSRMAAGIRVGWARTISEIYSSTETKAVQTAQYFSELLHLPVVQRAGLCENDRSSTGFLQPAEFERVADQFFGSPLQSVRGWETAAEAQSRIVEAVWEILAGSRSSGSLLIASHGAVGTLLYCDLLGIGISRKHDQLPNGGGNFFHVDCASMRPSGPWRPIDEP